jgi:anaerobic C4-dicarboxylate transporter
MDLLVTFAEKLLRKKPEWITFVGPTVAYLFTFCSGTGHVAYAILPVIAEVSRKAGVRPERPMSISVIASQQAITASPLAAATAGLLGILSTAGLEIAGTKVQLWHILAICIPSTFLGCMIGALSVLFVGKKLEDDPIYKDRLAKGLIEAPKATVNLQGQPSTAHAALSSPSWPRPPSSSRSACSRASARPTPRPRPRPVSSPRRSSRAPSPISLIRNEPMK